MALPQVTVEVGFTSPVTGAALHLGDPVRGLLGTGTLAPSDLFTDVSAWVRSWSTRRGATRADGPNVRYEAGTCVIELNNADRRFDPTNLAGPYVLAGRTQIEPMRRVRITAVWDGVGYPLFDGYADAWKVDYQGPSWSTVTLTATDAFKIFASHDRSESAPVGAGETTGARVNRILDSIAWPAEDRIVDTGDSTVQATTLAANVLTELQLTSDSELGEFYVDPTGHAVFRSRHALMDDPRSSTSQATFGDDPASSTEVPYASVQLEMDDTTFANRVSIARAGGTAQVAEDTDSIARYLVRTFNRTDLLLETDEEAASYAGFVLHQASTPELRYRQLTLINPRPQVQDRAWPQMLGRLFGDRVTIIRRPPGGGTITRDVFLRGVEHSSDGETWQTKFTLQAADRYSFFVLGDSNLGVLGANALGY